jgi:LmbE family N-acetylglucosaminyl deacetylase
VNDESLDWYKIAHFLDKGAKHLYERPLRLVWKEGPDGKKIVPELLPSDAWTQVLSLVQALPFDDLIQEKMTENDPSLQNLKSGSAPDISKSDTETILLSDQSIEGVSTQTLPKNKKIAVIEQTENDATAYAGNLIRRLEKENKIQRFSLSELSLLADFKDFLRKSQPDFVFLPHDRPEFEDMIQDFVNESGRKIIILSYVSLELFPFQNLFYPFSSETAQIVKKAIQVHKSQVTRTAYDQIFDNSSQAAGQKRQFYQSSAGDSPYAQAFRVAFIHQGKLEITPNDTRYKIGSEKESYTLNLSDDIPLLVISPHADDLEIAAGGLIRSFLEETQGPPRTRVLNWVIGTGDEWGVILDEDFADLSEESQVAIKRSMRRQEADDARLVLSKDTSGTMDVDVFSLSSVSQYPQGPNAILPMDDPRVFKDLRFFQRKLDFLFDDYFDSFKAGSILTVILPHPEDAHPHHQMATKIVLEALSQLSIAHGISIQLLFYSSPWAGRFNTYYVSNENQMLDENAPAPLKEKISIAEKVKRSLGIILGELVAGFGKKPLSFDELGGQFAERFMRKTILPTVPQKQVSLPEPEPQTFKIESSQRIFESAA